MTFVRRSFMLVLLLSLLFLGAGKWGRVSYASEVEKGPFLIRVSRDDWGTAEKLDLRPRRILDYGKFLWLELNEDDLGRLKEAGLSFQLFSDPYTLSLGGKVFDPLRQPLALPLGWIAVQSPSPDFQLVQLLGPTRAEWLSQLEARGLQIVQYIHPFTYVVWGEDQPLLDLERAADFIRWTGDFAPAYKVQPRWRALSKSSLEVHALFYRGANVQDAISQIEKLGANLTGREILNQTWEIAGFVLPGNRLDAVAQVPGVYSVQPVHTDGGLRGEMSSQVNVGNIAGNNIPFPGYLDWLSALGLSGQGVLMANVDAGVEDSHPDLVGRMAPCSGVTCGGGLSSLHGTHTAGIMGADGSSGVRDSFGFLRGLGMAPGAKLVEQINDPFFLQPGGMLKLMTESYRNGALLSSNSWGPSSTPKGYDDDTLQVDIGVRDAAPLEPGNQSFNYVLSIMNGYGGTSTQGTPDEAKNVLSVGATIMQKGDGSPNPNINELSSVTAHGPALDGRKLPMLVAPGCFVDSTIPGGYSVSLWCGTSMASPQVGGAVALFVERYRNLSCSDPSPALIKAAILPVAHDLAGNLDADGKVLGHPFDSKQGWGRLNAADVLDPRVPVQYFDNPVVFDDTGEIWERTLTAVESTQPVRMMLVWTDAPGHGLGGSTPAWNNDLDLQVDHGGKRYLGNNFGTDLWSRSGGEADFMNNTEGIFLAPTITETMTVRIVASNLTSDGVPNQGDSTDQDFSFVCYNCRIPGDPDVALAPQESSLAGFPGETITHTFLITNTGTIPDYFYLSAEGDWPMTLAPLSTCELNEGRSVTATLRVDIPLDAADQESNKGSLVVRSLVNPGVVARTLFTTTAVWHRYYFPFSPYR